jgi:hypothetical protein
MAGTLADAARRFMRRGRIAHSASEYPGRCEGGPARSKLLFRKDPGNISALMQDAHDFDGTIIKAIENRLGLDEH